MGKLNLQERAENFVVEYPEVIRVVACTALSCAAAFIGYRLKTKAIAKAVVKELGEDR